MTLDKKRFDEAFAQWIKDGLAVERAGRLHWTKKGKRWAKEKQAAARQRLIADGLVGRVGDTFPTTANGREEVEKLSKDNPG